MIEPLQGGRSMSLRGGAFADVAISTPHVLPCKTALMIDPLRGGHGTDAPETGKRWAIEIASHMLAMTEERRSR
jgi:hypothetical protein